MRQLHYESEALQEIFDAAEWYSLQEDGLRKCRFENFPYLMIYRIVEDQIRIYAVTHASRRPSYWKARL